MDVISVRPLRTASVVWRPKAGAWTLTVVAKLTYDLAPGDSPLALEQEDPHEEDGHWDDDPARSLRFASDLAPIKTLAEVTLIGSAYAPGGSAVRSFVARFRAGEMERAVEVHADRAVGPDGAVHEGAPIARMPLLYERARGGEGTWNPAGIPPGARDARGWALLPNLQAPGASEGAIEPIGFGPIAPSWPGRRGKLGRHDAPGPHPFATTPVPWGFDLGYFNSAPPEQQVQALRDNERIVLTNLHHEHARLSTRLPGVRPRAYVDRGGSMPQPVTLRPDTLAIHTDRSICTLTFRGHLPLVSPEEKGRILVAPEHGSEHLGWAEVVQAVSARLLSPAGSRRGSIPNIPPPSIPNTPPPSQARLPDPIDRLPEDLVSMTMADAEAGEALTDTLPFAKPKIPDPPAARESRPPESTPGLRSPAGAPAARGPAGLPFSPAGPPNVPAIVQPPKVPEPVLGAATPPPPAPVLRSLPGADSPWAGAAPAVPEPARGTIGTLAASQATQAEPAALRDTGAQKAVLRASNAAAGKGVFEATSEPKRPAPPPPAAASAPALVPTIDVIDLVWFDRAALPRVRKNPPWRALLRELEGQPADPDLDDATLGNTPAEIEDRRDVFEVLARGVAGDAAGIEEALLSAIRPDGKVVPPFVLAAGDLAFPFDEVETLKAHVAIIAPLAAGDEKLRSEIALVRDFLASPETSCAPPMVEALSNRLWEAFSRAKRAVPAETLRAHADSMLLQKRRFQRREVLGGWHLRALLHAGQGGGPFPAYLPASLAPILPMFQRFRARLFAEVHVAVDQHESCPTALRVVAVARVVERPRRAPAPDSPLPASPGPRL